MGMRGRALPPLVLTPQISSARLADLAAHVKPLSRMPSHHLRLRSQPIPSSRCRRERAQASELRAATLAPYCTLVCRHRTCHWALRCLPHQARNLLILAFLVRCRHCSPLALPSMHAPSTLLPRIALPECLAHFPVSPGFRKAFTLLARTSLF
eukprot:1755995-Pleurochrysis_carterae.AAC.1